MARHKWTFKARLRVKAYGWKGTSLATKRLNEAVREIKKVAKTDPVEAGDGAVALMERLWPSLQDIDGSSGALGSAVNRTLDALIPVLIVAPADQGLRAKWLDRLYEAVNEDGVQYLSPVENRWGEICAYPALAQGWADRLLPLVREVWSSEEQGAWVIGATICLSSLLSVGRYAELEELLSLHSGRFWHFDKFMAKALLRQGRTDEALEFAEACRTDRYDEHDIVLFCERSLLQAGRCDEAYRRYGLVTARAGTNLAWFRMVVQMYPHVGPRQILLDLIERRGERGKWFAAAKDAGFLDIALDCAEHQAVEPSTLIRAARRFSDSQPEFAAPIALLAIKRLLSGRGYEPTPMDIINAHSHLLKAASHCGQSDWAQVEVEKLMAASPAPGCEKMQEVLMTRIRP
jgi:hypothetical protein